MGERPGAKWRARSPRSPTNGVVILAEEGEDSLLRLAGEGRGLNAQPLAGLPGLQVGAFLIEVGQGRLAAPSWRVLMN